MAEAEVGDDVLGDDPTVIAIEERAAELLGKEAAIFVTSGTQGNLVSQLAHLRRNDETIAGLNSHINVDEASGHAVIVRTTIYPILEQPDGSLDLGEVRAAIRPDDVHYPATGMLAIENTQALSMGQPLSLEYTQAAGDLAHEHGFPLHIDGARFFNAAVSLGVSPRALAAPADSLTFCLSKSLSCPIGSLIVGDRDFIFRARRARKMVGGGMRQVGILAAAGLIALQDGPAGMIDRLAEDHANAKRLAEAMAEMPGIYAAGYIAQPGDGPFDPGRVRTNFILFRVKRDRAAFIEAVAHRGVMLVGYPFGMIRAVTHYGVTADDVETAIRAIQAGLRDTSPQSTRSDDDGLGATEPAEGVLAGRPRVVTAH